MGKYNLTALRVRQTALRQKASAKSHNKKPSKLFQPLKIKYEEDQLRKEFFRDHPWELARPRIVLEKSGKDFENYDWSRLQQPGRRLDGER